MLLEQHLYTTICKDGGGGDGYLTTKQIARLAPTISSVDMETIALGYLDLDEEWIASMRVEKAQQLEAFNRAVIRKWANMNSTPKQVKVYNCAH